MAFGGVQVNRVQGAPSHYHYSNYVHIEGLTVENLAGPPFDLTNPAFGEFTTSQTPGPGQNVIPKYWGRGAGNWRPGDEFSVLSILSPIFEITVAPNASLLAFAKVPSSPRVVNGDLEITYVNLIGDLPGNPVECHFSFLFLHTLIQ